MPPHVQAPRIFLMNNLVYFRDALFNGYGQVLICLNPLTGILFSFIIFFVSKTVFLLSLLGVLFATLTAVLIKAKPSHVYNGVYGFNGVILGIAWPWFLKINFVSTLLLIGAACLSSCLIKFLTYINLRTKTNLPFLSVPAVLLVWMMVVLFKYSSLFNHLVGPDEMISTYLQSFQMDFLNFSSDLDLFLFLRTFNRHLIILVCIFLAVGMHSRLSLMLSIFSFLLTLGIVYCLGGYGEFKNIEFYLYNSIPCGVALGGTFLVLTRPVIMFSFFGVLLCNVMIFFGFKFFPLPVFVFPFNLVAISFIWLIKSGLLKREQEFYAVPMDLVSTPETGLSWLKGEIYAQNYWREIERTRYPL